MAHGFASRKDAERVAAAALWVEHRRKDDRVNRPRWKRAPGGLRWYQLTARLDAGGTATADRGEWDSANDEWDGTGAEATITDTTASHWGLTGEWLLCRGHGGIIEPIASGQQFHTATLSGDLAAGSSANATVTIGGQSVTVLVYDHGSLGMATGKKICSGTTVRIYYEVESTHWIADWTKCENIQDSTYTCY